MSRFGDRLRMAREAARLSQASAGAMVNLSAGAIGKIERGETARSNKWDELAAKVGIPQDEANALIAADAADAGKDTKIGALMPIHGQMSATFSRNMTLSRIRRRDTEIDTIPLLGLAAAGEPNRLVMLNESSGRIETPPELVGVEDAYALYVYGTSMTPRYLPGEIVYVHPFKPVTEGGFCVVQVGSDPANPDGGYIKQFKSWDADTLTLTQFNPPGEMTFPSEQVISVHRIVGVRES